MEVACSSISGVRQVSKMNTPQAAQRLLDALDAALPHAPLCGEFDIVADAADDLRAALKREEEAPTQETDMTNLRTAAQQALEALEFVTLDFFMLNPISPGRESTIKAITALRAALAEPEEDPELSAALGWAAGISEPALDRKALLRRVAELAQDMQAKTKRAWDVGYDCGLKAATERRLSDAEIGEVWFAAKIPGVTETQARVLIRAAEDAR